ncbi:Methyl-CpG DNA binding [Parasponia andersonii]|uniref:Methyl-CpG DNA binding n=1 Tax=Parasponia andersonii TaxID=3476 RepID=A0A2P5CXH6_PARAD|nr:Methyl-CpG DNA binding [Parasponia andersonii]
MDSEDTPKTSSNSKRSRSFVQSSVSVYAAQCDKCLKWRVISTQEEFEDIRSKIIEEPYYCSRRPQVTCDDPADIEYDSTRTWVIDKPNLPKTPKGFRRSLVLRRDYSKIDVYYITPLGKKVRTRNEVAAFLKANPAYEGTVSPEDFIFAIPKIMEDTIPENIVVPKRASTSFNGKKKLKTMQNNDQSNSHSES